MFITRLAIFGVHLLRSVESLNASKTLALTGVTNVIAIKFGNLRL